MCKKPSQRRKVSGGENKSRYVSNKKKAKRAVAEAMKKETVKEVEEIRNDRNVEIRRKRMMKKEASDLAGNNCIRHMF